MRDFNKERMIQRIDAEVASWPEELQDKAARLLSQVEDSPVESVEIEACEEDSPMTFEEVMERMAESPYITRAKARFDDPEPLTLMLSHGQMACLRDIVTQWGDGLLEQGHTEATSGYLKLVLGIEYLIEESLDWPEEPTP